LEERVYVRRAADAPDHAADARAKPGGLLRALQTLGRSKPTFQAEEVVEKERPKKQEMAPIVTKASLRDNDKLPQQRRGEWWETVTTLAQI
jgi:hypothetical protein